MSKPSFFINANAFLSDTTTMTCQEVGALIMRLCRASKRRDKYEILSHRFVEGVVLGTSKREYLPEAIRKDVLSVGVCAKCGAIENLTVDHVFPYSLGGKHLRENLQCLCGTCNRKKGNKI